MIERQDEFIEMAQCLNRLKELAEKNKNSREEAIFITELEKLGAYFLCWVYPKEFNLELSYQPIETEE